jgi:7-keto-8-aminopelargonate synthetase-like enzyme
MFGDVAPVKTIANLLDRYPSLHVYFDDAHGFSWSGLHGRGFVLDQVPFHPRMVIAVGMAKSFGSGGAALAFADPDFASRVLLTGGPLTFSGPIHNAELGAAVVSADIHLSPEHAERQDRLLHQIDLVASLAKKHRIPMAGYDRTPIWFVPVGRQDATIDFVRRLMAEGFYVNASAFPAVPIRKTGIRFTQTIHHADEQLEALMSAIARHLPTFVDDFETTIDLTQETAEATVRTS